CSSKPAELIQDRNSTVFPLPGGADTTVTRAAPSRPNSRGRDTTLPATEPAAPATASAPAPDRMAPDHGTRTFLGNASGDARGDRNRNVRLVPGQQQAGSCRGCCRAPWPPARITQPA